MCFRNEMGMNGRKEMKEGKVVAGHQKAGSPAHAKVCAHTHVLRMHMFCRVVCETNPQTALRY